MNGTAVTRSWLPRGPAPVNGFPAPPCAPAAAEEGGVPTVALAVLGVPCLGLAGGPELEHSGAFSASTTGRSCDGDAHAVRQQGVDLFLGSRSLVRCRPDPTLEASGP